MTDGFFRAGVGAVVRDARGLILALRRKDTLDGAWQLPQGGVHFDEAPTAALYRELYEEAGLAREAIRISASVSEWLVYEVPIEYRNAKIGWGQAQRWYLCELLQPLECVQPDHMEFDAADWVTGIWLLQHTAAFRVPLYQRLLEEFGD